MSIPNSFLNGGIITASTKENTRQHESTANVVLRQSALQASECMSGDSIPRAPAENAISVHTCLSPVATGGISTFGTMLTPLYGSSSLNPTNMTQNCVSVTLAKLLAHKDVYELWHDTYGSPLSDSPMSIDDVVNLVHRTGWSFRWEEYWIYPHLSTTECLRDADTLGHGYGCLTALLYFRPDGSGHCVVRDLSKAFVPLCYQFDEDGTSFESDIKTNAKTVCLLRLKCPANTKMHQAWLDRLLLRTIEKRAAERYWPLEHRIYRNIHKWETHETFEAFHKTLRGLCTWDKSQSEDTGTLENPSWNDSAQECQPPDSMENQRLEKVIRAKL